MRLSVRASLLASAPTSRLARVRASLLALALALVLALCGCASTTLPATSPSAAARAESTSARTLDVVTTLFAPYDFVKAIAGDTLGADVTVHMLLKPGTESHSYDPTVQDILRIKNCDLFIYTGGENDAWVEDILDSINEPVNTLRMMDFCTLVEEEDVEGMQTLALSHEHEGGTEGDAGSEDAEWDEHVWTSPLNAISITQGICQEMSALDPLNEDTFTKNTASYVDELKSLDADIHEVVESAKRHTVIFADRFPVRYFTEEFGLDYYAAFPGCAADNEASAATVAFLIDKVKSEDIPAVFYIEMSNEKMADTIAAETGAQKLLFHSCHVVTAAEYEAGTTYIDIMRQNLENLKVALN